MDDCHEGPEIIFLRIERPNEEKNKSIKKPYECETCLKKFKTRKELKIHSRVHTNERPFNCKQCGKAFKQSSTLNTHINTHTGLIKHPCSVCKVEFTTGSSLRRHVKRIHVGGKSYPCSLCNETLISKLVYIKHRDTHIKTILNISDTSARNLWQQKIFKCTLCDETYAKKVKLFEHLRVHYKTKYPCKYCSESFRMRVMKTHIKQKHCIETCSICKKHFVGKKEYLLHQKRHFHMASDTCDYCEETFSSSVELQYHMPSTHCSNTNNNHCSLCVKSFNDPDHLQKHKNFAHVKCISCEEYFQRYNEMATHFNHIHKAFKCLLCKCIFRLKSHLAFHLNTYHLIINKFSCNICGKKYRRYKHLCDHKETHAVDIIGEIEKSKKKGIRSEGKNNQILDSKMIPNKTSCIGSMEMFNKRKLLTLNCPKFSSLEDDLNSKCESRTQRRVVKKRCIFCYSVFSTSTHFLKHNLYKHGKYVCVSCDAVFFSSKDRENHKQVHRKPRKLRNNKRMFNCSICNVLVLGRLNLESHIQATHMIETDDGKRIYNCQYCWQLVKHRHNFIWHQFKHHPQQLPEEIRQRLEAKVMCSSCGKLFPKKSDFDRHMAKHEEFLPLKITEEQAQEEHESVEVNQLLIG